jgi:hypothetical protein
LFPQPAYVVLYLNQSITGLPEISLPIAIERMLFGSVKAGISIIQSNAPFHENY